MIILPQFWYTVATAKLHHGKLRQSPNCASSSSLYRGAVWQGVGKNEVCEITEIGRNKTFIDFLAEGLLIQQS